MRVCQKSQVVRPEGAIWAFSSHCLSFDFHTLTQVTLYQMFFMFIAVYILSVFVKALPYTHINLPDKLQFISLQLSESPK